MLGIAGGAAIEQVGLFEKVLGEIKAFATVHPGTQVTNGEISAILTVGTVLERFLSGKKM